MPGNSIIKGEKLGAAEMPEQPPPIKGMTDASNNDFTTNPTFTRATIEERRPLRNTYF